MRLWKGRDQEAVTEVNNHKIDVCALSEIRRKDKEMTRYEKYIPVYSGESKKNRITSLGFGIHEGFEPYVKDHRMTRHY